LKISASTFSAELQAGKFLPTFKPRSHQCEFEIVTTKFGII